jgi:His/Glu/Gln/Arg/opine family amino acid ABC transporter permease subunit
MAPSSSRLTVFMVLAHNLSWLLYAASITLALSAVCTVLASAIGLIVALAGLFGGRPVRFLTLVYLYVVRGTPLLVLVIGTYYVLPYTGIEPDAVSSGIIVLSVYHGAFMSEVFRGALLSVPRGQWDAGRALGLHGFPLLMMVVMKQALRVAGPPFVNSCVMLVKNTSIVSVIGLWELTLAGRQVAERTLAPFQIFAGVAAIYFLICYGLTLLGRTLETWATHAVETEPSRGGSKRTGLLGRLNSKKQ